MQSDHPSSTAAFVATARGLASFLPEPAQLALDPHGLAFGWPWVARLARHRALVQALLRPRSRLERGLLWLQLRTRAIDDMVVQFVAEGGRQVVLLGAGYDTRALRLAALAPELTFFEVDHPATQAHKRRVLAREQLAVPRARYLPWDFEARPLSQLTAAVAELGHARAAPTLTIWEGVTMYLSATAVDASVRAVRALSAPGSRLALTYFEHTGLRAQTLTRQYVARLGEPMQFAWRRGALAPYLEARGLHLLSDESAPQLARRLLPEPFASRSLREFRHVAWAEVSGS